jgi:hypothetical protein
VRFVDRDSGETLCEANVGLVAESDFGTGTATCQWKAELGKNEDSASWTVGVVVEGWYGRDRREDDTVVTVSRPLDDMITGGGFVMLEESAGLRAGDAGSRTNFGFNVKFNKSGQKLQGRINVILRRTEDDGVVHVYQLKGNVMSSMATDEDAGVAIFNGKASIQDITESGRSGGRGRQRDAAGGDDRPRRGWGGGLHRDHSVGQGWRDVVLVAVGWNQDDRTGARRRQCRGTVR